MVQGRSASLNNAQHESLVSHIPKRATSQDVSADHVVTVVSHGPVAMVSPTDP